MQTIKVPLPKVKVAVRSEITTYLGNNSETTEANLRKLHRKIEHHEKVPMPKVKVTITSEVKLCLKLCCS